MVARHIDYESEENNVDNRSTMEGGDNDVGRTRKDEYEQDGQQYSDDGDKGLGMNHADKNTTENGRSRSKNSCHKGYTHDDDDEEEDYNYDRGGMMVILLYTVKIMGGH